MKISNKQLADTLNHIAEVLEAQEENPYRIRAYKRAAKSLLRFPQEVSELIKSEIPLTTIPHVGIKLEEVIKEIIKTNNLDWLPNSHSAITIPSHAIKKKTPIFRIYSVLPVAARLLKKINMIAEVEKVEVLGDFRRGKDLIDHLPILILTNHTEAVFNRFLKLASIRCISDKNENMLKVQLKYNIWVTLYVAHNLNQFYYMMFVLTGSDTHVEAIRQLAKEKNIHLQNDAKNERSIYQQLNMPFIPPELRENRGEIQLADTLPNLISLSDIKGDLHCHTNETDGNFTLEEMALAAQEMGYEYVAITDHSKSLRITNGMDEARLLRQIEKIDHLNERLKGFKILKSMEIDILEDGTLDLADSVLKQLDITVCSVHSKFHLSSEKQTTRILKAMDHPNFNILGHATGRLIKSRPPYPVDIEKILRHALENNCFMELNAQPARLDINDVYCKKAKEIGVKIAISSDAHTTAVFSFMSLGIQQARRGWLEPDDVINTRSYRRLKILLKK